MPLSAKVKNVVGGDTLVLVPPKLAQPNPPERTLTLQHVRGDSPAAREFLRQLAIGKEVQFSVDYKHEASGREFGDASLPLFASLALYLVQLGWVKVKDNVRAASDAEEEHVAALKAAEAAAREQGLGVWAKGHVDPATVAYSPALVDKSKKRPLKAVVERVLGGDRVVVRAYKSPAEHAVQPVLLAGIKVPRTDDADPKLAAAGRYAKAYVEDHLLTTRADLHVRFLGENQTGVPIVLIQHPLGNSIHAKVLENGWGEVVDWQLAMVGADTMQQLRRAEQLAKLLAKGIHGSAEAPAPTASAGASKSGKFSTKSLRPGAATDVVVTKVITGDSFNVRLASDEEITVQLASLRSPRNNDTTVTSNGQHQLALVAMAREFSRQLVVGRTAHMTVDGHRPAKPELNIEARFVVSLSVNGKDVAEKIVAAGLASVVRHNKQTAGERSLNWDKLIELEEKAKLQKAGVWTGDLVRTLTVSPRVVNASELAQKAKTFLNGFAKKGRLAGWHVDFVAAGNRVKLYNPKEGLRLTLVLGGLARTDAAAAAYVSRKYLQRSVEFDVYDVDKVGGFIGNLYASAQALSPVQVELLSAGLAEIHEAAASSNRFEGELVKAEAAAKAAKKGVWANYDEALVTQAMSEVAIEAKPQFFDVEVVDVGADQVLSFHFVDAATSAKFAQFKADFNEFHLRNPSASANSVDLPVNLAKAPKKNDMVAAKFENGKYYRARVINFDRLTNTYDVKHVDFGNVDQVPLSAMRVLPRQFALDTIKPFAHTCRLQNIELPPSQPRDYLSEALEYLEDLVFDKKLVISALPGSGVEYNVVLYDSEQSVADPDYTINKQLVEDGYGLVKGAASDAVKSYVDELVAAERKAKAKRVGCWELGDIRGEED